MFFIPIRPLRQYYTSPAIVLIGLLLSGCGGSGSNSGFDFTGQIPSLPPSSSQHPVYPPLNTSQLRRIVAIGDSITQQGGGTGGYLWQIRRLLQEIYPGEPFEVISAGVEQHDSRQMRERFTRDVLNRNPTLVTISVGIVDAVRSDTPEGITVEQFRSNVEAIIQAARQRNIEVVLFTPTIFEDSPDSVLNQRLAGYTAALRSLAEQHGLRLADQNLAFMDYWQMNSGEGANLTRDTVHLTLLGNTLMARTALLAFGITEAQWNAARRAVSER